MRRVTLGMGVAALVALTAPVGALAALRSRVMPRRDPRVPWSGFEVMASDGVRVRARCMPGAGEAALIVATRR